MLKKVFFLGLCIICLFSPSVRADIYSLDDAPYWFWADEWKGELYVFYRDVYEIKKTFAEGYFNYKDVEEGEVTASSVSFDKSKVKLTFKRWRGGGNVASVLWKEEEPAGGFSQNAEGYGKLDALNVIHGQANTFLDMESEVVIDIEEKAFRITLLLPVEFEMETKKDCYAILEGTDEGGQRQYKFTEKSEPVLPSLRGEVVSELPETGEGFQGTEDMNDV